VVHQLDHFQEELLSLAEKLSEKFVNNMKVSKEVLKKENRQNDLIWQLFNATRCLFDCSSSIDFQSMAL
jgi:hypothetical protein